MLSLRQEKLTHNEKETAGNMPVLSIILPMVEMVWQMQPKSVFAPVQKETVLPKFPNKALSITLSKKVEPDFFQKNRDSFRSLKDSFLSFASKDGVCSGISLVSKDNRKLMAFENHLDLALS